MLLKSFLIIVSCLLLSKVNFSQTVTKSNHPKLDSLFQRSSNNTNSTENSYASVKTVTGKSSLNDASKIWNSSSAGNKMVFTNTGGTDNATQPIYRDTRLGSSSPLYNTYEKNDYGAGAVTTSPK